MLPRVRPGIVEDQVLSSMPSTIFPNMQNLPRPSSIVQSLVGFSTPVAS